jgi:predicted amidohydrolase
MMKELAVKMRLALAQWRIEKPATWDQFAKRIDAAISNARESGAEIAVLPEYLALELASTLAPDVRSDFVATLGALQSLHEQWLSLFSRIARTYGVYIVAGSFLLAMPNGRYRNRSYLFTPNGKYGFQDKLTLTGFELSAGVIEPGDALKLFDTRHGRVAINICYDAEFPLYARSLAEAGARILFVPSCTDTEAGATRVRVGCMARALENRLYVAQSVTTGDAPDNPALDTNTGYAAVYAPSDRGMPEDGIIARGDGTSTWVLADVDLDRLEAMRDSGQVANAIDWDQQLRPGVTRARVEPL